MEIGTATESALTAQQAADYLRETHSITYTPEYLDRLANSGRVPSHKVGRSRRYRRTLLNQYALGEWAPAPAGAA